MSNTFASISNAVGRLKIFYDGTVVDQFNEEIPYYKIATADKKSYTGVQVNRGVRVLRHDGLGSGTDGGNLPHIGNTTVVQATINAKFNWLRIGLTSGMLKAASNDKGAFVREFTYSVETAMDDLKQSINRQLGWNGNGAIASLNAAATATNVITVIGRETGEPGDQFMQVGYVIDVVSTGGSTEASGVTVSAMSVSGSVATLTLSSPVTVSSGSIVVLSGSYNNDVQGALYTLDGGTGTIYNINRSTYSQFQGNVVDAASAQLSLDLLQQGWNLGKRRGGAKYKGIISNFDSLRYYLKISSADRRYVSTAAVKPDLGFDMAGVEGTFNGIPWYSDKDAPQRIYMLDDNWLMYILAEMEVAAESGAELIPQVDTDSFEMRLRYFANLFCAKPSANVALKSFLSP